MPEVHIAAFWRNNQPINRFFIEYRGILDDDQITSLQQAYRLISDALESQPEQAGAYMLGKVEAFARVWKPIGVQLRLTPEIMEIILMIAALERKKMIVSDEYTGVIGLARYL